MILTLTPNPSLDKTLQLDRLERGAVNRAVGGRVDAGGKGVNVSRALAAHGIASTAVLPLGGSDGSRMGAMLAAAGVSVRAVDVSAGPRTNITVAEPDGVTTKINEPGPQLSPGEIASLVDAVLEMVTPGTWVAGCGSLPVGAPVDFYADLVGRLHERGARVVVDSSGPALQAVLEKRPDLIKPNLEELAEAVGRGLRTLGDVVDAADELLGRGITTVLASLGPDGALLATGDLRLYGSARVEQPRSTVGAGDALLAGYLGRISQSNDPTQALRSALAWGAAATSLPGSRMPGPDDVAAIRVVLHEHLDVHRKLSPTT
ncbi:1-phosphofructokinase [Kineosporia sp. NBRC 101731]|uniref:1-phosphofructokinase n=1 Tax=Kineosporia sp. NBRC 101731 TaxID=3032199 RepID=UPI0024A4A466|nr:1-phosphofructokinase [Kineosporia sp. NBRC 101731]GLY32269.1 1-phosphofructokinase [Kineosporia sp. NBRC 101731]